MRTFYAKIIGLSSIAASLVSFRLYASPCLDLQGNSCWHAQNLSSFPVKIRCDLPYGARFGANLPPSQESSHQFDTGFGDGLGFPDGGQRVTCTTTWLHPQGTKTGSISFATLDWGDFVEIKVEESRVVLTDSDSYQLKPSKTYEASAQ